MYAAGSFSFWVGVLIGVILVMAFSGTILAILTRIGIFRPRPPQK